MKWVLIQSYTMESRYGSQVSVQFFHQRFLRESYEPGPGLGTGDIRGSLLGYSRTDASEQIQSKSEKWSKGKGQSIKETHKSKGQARLLWTSSPGAEIGRWVDTQSHEERKDMCSGQGSSTYLDTEAAGNPLKIWKKARRPEPRVE